MGIPESQLETWSHQGSVTQSKNTYATVKSALEAADTKYAGRQFDVFLQGSYGNDTNIYAESDVDVVIRLDSIYYYDISGLNAQDLAAFKAGFTPATYSYSTFKSEVIAALVKTFGATAVTPDKRAVKIEASGSRRSADVVVAAQFRRYYSRMFGPSYHGGICFFTSSGDQIVNYPKQHSANCTKKHQATNQWYKPAVRILKNLRSKLVEDGKLDEKAAPSYFLEGLLYNVPEDKFGRSYEDTMVGTLNWILAADRTKLRCANEQYFLVRDSAATCWPCAKCDGFMNAAVKLWNNWS